MLTVVGPGGIENVHAHQWSGGKTTPETHEKHEGTYNFLASFENTIPNWQLISKDGVKK